MNCDLANREICSQDKCDRKLVGKVYKGIIDLVYSCLDNIEAELRRGFRLKKHPHSVVYRIGMPVPLNRLSDEVKAYVNEAKNDQSSSVPIRNYVIERTLDMIKRMRDDRQKENLMVIDGVVEACLVYQIAVDSLLGLRGYLDEASKRFTVTHKQYDEMLRQFQTAKQTQASSDEQANGGSELLTAMWQEISNMQDQLDEQKLILQRLINQVPYFISRVKEEHDFMGLYNDMDDTIAIHVFLVSAYVRNEVQQHGNESLKQAYSKIKHHWRDFTPMGQ